MSFARSSPCVRSRYDWVMGGGAEDNRRLAANRKLARTTKARNRKTPSKVGPLLGGGRGCGCGAPKAKRYNGPALACNRNSHSLLPAVWSRSAAQHSATHRSRRSNKRSPARRSRDRGSIRNERPAERSAQYGRGPVFRSIDRPRIAGPFAEPLPEDRPHPLPSPSSNRGATMLPSSPWLLASQSTGLKRPSAGW
jgi:hypothetical protein